MRVLNLVRLGLVIWLGLSYNINAEISGHLAEHHHGLVHEDEHEHDHGTTQQARLTIVEGAAIAASSHEHFGLDTSVFTFAQARDFLPEIASANTSLSFDPQTNNIAFPGFFYADLAYSPPPWRFRNLPMLN